MMSSLSLHAAVARTALRRMFVSPVAGFFNVLVIGIALCLPAGMYVLLQNAQGLVEQLSAAPEISLFLAMDATESDIGNLRDRLAKNGAIGNIAFVSRTDALNRLGQSTGMEDVIAGLESNPLPDAFVVSAKSANARALDALKDELQHYPKVELAQLDSAWAYKLEAILGFARIAALLLASRRGLHAVAWIVSAGGALTALALMAASGRLVPGALYLALLGAATLWIGYVRGWTLLRWPAALVADVVALLVAVHAVDRGSAEGPGAALLLQIVLVALVLGSVATRTLYMGRKVVPFEMVQSAAVIAVGIGGAVWVALRSGHGQAGFGVASLAFGAAAYGVAFAFVERRQKIRENFYFYSSVGIVLVLTGGALLLSGGPQAVAWAVLALALGGLSRRVGSRTLAAHAAAYAIAGALASGLVAGSAGALFAGSTVAWSPSAAAILALLAAAGCAWLTTAVPRKTALERVPPLAVELVVALGAAGTAVAWLAPAVTGGAAGGGALATLRTAALVGAVLAVTAAGRSPAMDEAGWLSYPLLGVTGIKMLLEDLPRGRPASLILAFALYGAALILVPRLRARRRGGATVAPATTDAPSSGGAPGA